MILRALFVEHGAGEGKRDPAPVAHQQRPTDFFFQAPDAFAQRGLGNVQARGRAAEMQLFGQDCERGQVPGFQLHTLKLSQACNHFIGRIAAPAIYLSIY